MDSPTNGLVDLLALEEIERNIFRGKNEGGQRERLFGGQVAAQALAAAGRTVEGRSAHSLHAYFLRPGDPSLPVLYTVDRIRDGQSFTTRRVVAVQKGQAIFTVAVSFQVRELGYEHQQLEMPAAPPPESLPTWQERAAALPQGSFPWTRGERPVDLRHVEAPTFLGGPQRRGGNLVWFRATGALPEDPFFHRCVVAYASDMSLLDTVILPHGRTGPLGALMMASLDHALWFHKDVRADEWLLYAQESPVAAGARGFARGTIFTRAGELVASVAQEGLMRPTGQAHDRSL
ncbi:MAG TPA: acyl-CoA thioesterase II [Myxococcota bacterium]|nr:acyl-CoA thioesterase II [Myxococcota bacterium]